ncbi:Lysophospholipase L1 [Klenkia soli]|uniref:Lysophospholipase L1 n=1 Tax=Klenkia soli TaxID=1052260 RepID=A0A1H0TPU3_9ACTN|nr:SGNH/GDSL hydrolase family protein [Klenkia soli]SDP55740.1 Lysophospholipase L1 [Klenkia soli]
MRGRAAAAGGLVGAVLVLAGCAVPVARSAAAVAPAAPTADPLRVVVVGDSITEMSCPDFDAGVLARDSWTWWATGQGVHVLGGWAHAGATTEDMLAGVAAEPPADADVLVLMAGNNDIDWDVPTQQVLDQLVQIADAVGIPRVVLSAVAPEDGLGAETLAMDDALARLADEEGWQYVDPMGGIRDDDGDYRDGATLDGVHPTEEASVAVGRALREALLDPADVVPAGQTR